MTCVVTFKKLDTSVWSYWFIILFFRIEIYMLWFEKR